MKLSRREKMFIAILVILAVGYLTDRFIIYPVEITSNQLLNSKTALESQLKQMDSLTVKYGNEAHQRFIETNYRRILAEIPPSAMVPSVIEFLQSRAADTAVKVITISYLDAASLEPYSDHRLQNTPKTLAQQINFQIEAEGDYADILGFLQYIEDAPRLYTITKVKIVLPQDLITASTASGSTTNLAEVEHSSSQINPAYCKLFLEFSAYYYTLP